MNQLLGYMEKKYGIFILYKYLFFEKEFYSYKGMNFESKLASAYITDVLLPVVLRMFPG